MCLDKSQWQNDETTRSLYPTQSRHANTTHCCGCIPIFIFRHHKWNVWKWLKLHFLIFSFQLIHILSSVLVVWFFVSFSPFSLWFRLRSRFYSNSRGRPLGSWNIFFPFWKNSFVTFLLRWCHFGRGNYLLPWNSHLPSTVYNQTTDFSFSVRLERNVFPRYDSTLMRAWGIYRRSYKTDSLTHRSRQTKK